MRDLSGRRQRDVNNEKKLVKYVEGAAERERLEREKKEAKMEKLRMMAEGEVYNRDKHSFSDADYDKVYFTSTHSTQSVVNLDPHNCGLKGTK